MAAIAGTTTVNASSVVLDMLSKMQHRGNFNKQIIEKEGTTYGVSWNDYEETHVREYLTFDKVCNCKGPVHIAWAKPLSGSFHLHRDELGVVPIYYGWNESGRLYFASEVKALFPYVSEIIELLPGSFFDGNVVQQYYEPTLGVNRESVNPETIARELRERLEDSILSLITSDNIGSWLSGGLDSSAICAVAAKHLKTFKTFAAGLRGASDLEYAREVASFIKSDHYEVIVTFDEMIKILPDVIYHLESFDALLVRSGIINYLVARKASEHVSEVFSGEGGDELFAGYEYLKSLSETQLRPELIKITKNLHNTALQRVDRCSSAHGTTALLPFLMPQVIDCAFSIPVKYKMCGNIEKWILRRALDGELPEKILNRTKAKFWEGAGVREIFYAYAEKKISDSDFKYERKLMNGWILNTKEELFYYKIFRDFFGSKTNLSWMGRTVNSPLT